MMGTSLLSMPWALEQAGLVMGLLMMVSINQINTKLVFLQIDIAVNFPWALLNAI